MKIQPIYSLKEKFTNDYHKNSDLQWLMALLPLIILALTFLFSVYQRAHADNNYPVYEDYTSEIEQLHFGDVLKAQIYSLDNKWNFPLDLDRLAKAVATHETKDCGLNYGASAVNNCFGIRQCSGGHCHGFKKYASTADSYGDFKRIWSTYYKKYPTMKEANKWTGRDRAKEWLITVNQIYFSI